MTENKQEILKKAKELLELSYGHDQSNRKEMKTDLLFSTGFQWSKREIEERGDRPTLTVDKLNQHLKLATGDIRNNPPAIDVFPNDNKSDVKTAKTYTELIRQIEYQSNASFIYSYAGQMAASCGLGAWRLDTKYIDDSTFEQEIKLRHIPNPLSVFFDSLAIEPDKSDVKYVFVTEMMNERDFKEKYPGKKVVSVEQKDPSGDDFLWGGQEKIRVAEYWYKKPVKKHLVQLVDGTTKDVTEEIKSKADLETLKRHPDVAAYRHADSEEVHQVVISGDEILSGPVKWPGKYIPIFIVPGDETPLEDKTHRSSVIRRARDPQKIYNYNRSAAIEHIGMANKQPFLATVKQVGKYLGQWKNANQSNASVLLYEPDPDVPGGKPSRERPADPPGAIWQEGQMANDDIKSVTGIYDASLGNTSNETSGKAINARQRQGDIANSDLSKKLSIAVAHCGRVLVDLIPKIYDSERVIRLLGEDGEHRFVTIRKIGEGEQVDEDTFDLSVGRFDVRIKTGPSYATRRQEQADKLIELMQARPDLWPVIGDLVFASMDFPESEEIAKRIKKAIPPQLLIEEDEEGSAPQQQPPINPLQQQAQMLELQQMAAKIAKMQADSRKAMAQASNQELETEILSSEHQETENLKALQNSYQPIAYPNIV